MGKKAYLVTGGAGFIGSMLVYRLVREGYRVRVLDDQSRGNSVRLRPVADEIEFIDGDIRDGEAVHRAVQNMDGVFHLASVNGTEFFYAKPDLVLDVGVKGMVHVLDACIKHGVGELILASSSETYQMPAKVPTDETVPLSIPDPLNPRYSYAGVKIISELMLLNYARTHFDRAMIFRPHNVYGPDMGWEHVLPQFVLRMKRLCSESEGRIDFPIQGSGKQTRSFVFIEDFIDGLMILLEKGQHREIYHIGTMEEVEIGALAHLVGEYFGRQIRLVPGTSAEIGPARRCPDIAKLAALGYRPQFTLSDGLPVLARWYDENAHRAPKSDQRIKEENLNG